MPNIEVRGRYRAFTYDGTTSLDFTTYANNLCVIRRPNEISFRTLRQYIPAVNPIFTTFEPGSAYVIITRGNDASFDIGPYTRVDRLPSTLNIKDPLYYLGMDKNSITIPLSVYALSINTPLSSVTGITYVNGAGVGQSTVTVDQIRDGFATSFTHFLPNSGYQLRNRVPYTFFAPLQSEMGDAYAWGENNGAYGMGYYLSPYSAVSAHNIYGLWDKIAVGGTNIIFEDPDTGEYISSNFVLALSTCGNVKKLFATGSNNLGQLGTGDNKNRFTWTAISGEWSDIAVGESTSYALSTNGKLFSTGYNLYGQTGTTTDVSILSVANFTQETLNGTWSQIAAGGQCLLALSANGKLFGCGLNSSGQLGLGHNDTAVYTLTQEVNNGYYTKIYTNGTSSYTLYYSTLRGCGYNYNGELGTGDNVSKNTFVPEVCGLNVTDVFVGNATFIRTGENYLRGAGYNANNRRLILTNSNSNPRRNTFEPTLIPNTIKTMVFRLEGGGMNKFFTIDSNNQLITYRRYSSGLGLITENLGINYFNIFSNNDSNSNVIIALSARNDLRPTPTITVTPTITPTISLTPSITPTITLTRTPTITPTKGATTTLQKMSFLAQGTSLGQFYEIREYTDNLTTLSKITVGPNYTSNTQMVMAYENGVNNSLVAMITDGTNKVRYFKRWNGTSWDTVSTPANLAPPSTISSPSTDNLFIAADNTYYFFYFNSSSSSGVPLYVSSSTDRGVTWSTPAQVNSSAYNFFANGTALVAAQDKTNTSNFKLGYPTSSGLYSYPYSLISNTGTIYNYNYNCDRSGAFHSARVSYGSPNYNLYYDENLIKSDTTIAQNYTTMAAGGTNTNLRSPIIGLEYSQADINIAYILYLRRYSSLRRSGFAVIEYNTSTNTIISDTYVAKVAGDANSALFTMSPSLATEIETTKMVVFSDNSIGVFICTFEGSPNFRMSFHIFKRSAGGTWSYSSGPLYINTPNDTSYGTYATRYI